MKRLPVSAILLLLTASWAGSACSAPWDPYTPPGDPVAPRCRTAGVHPAVVRVIAPERQGMSLGSGVLVGHSEQLGLVVTNWHVVQDAAGTILVAFPDGFRSAARLLKTDRHWDLAALAIWRPNVTPVPLAGYMPRRGEPLTIAGYGSGHYRTSRGHLVDYAAPAVNFPFELLEVSTPARQGDSGGPIFNSRGEVAGVLFGTGGGRTMGAYCGRVRAFLLTVLPDFERLEPEPAMVAVQPAPDNAPAAQSAPQAVAQQLPVQMVPDPVPPVFETQRPAAAPRPGSVVASIAAPPSPSRPAQVARVGPKPQTPPSASSRPAPPSRQQRTIEIPAAVAASPASQPASGQASAELAGIGPPQPAMTEEPAESPLLSWTDLTGTTRAEQVKTVLAALGALFLLLSALRLLGEMDGSRVQKPALPAKPAGRRSRRAA